MNVRIVLALTALLLPACFDDSAVAPQLEAGYYKITSVQEFEDECGLYPSSFEESNVNVSVAEQIVLDLDVEIDSPTELAHDGATLAGSATEVVDWRDMGYECVETYDYTYSGEILDATQFRLSVSVRNDVADGFEASPDCLDVIDTSVPHPCTSAWEMLLNKLGV